MPFCLGIRVADGLVCLADGHITSGNQVSNAQNLSMHGSGPAQFAVLTSGLRSLRDKTLAYLERDMGQNHATGFAPNLDAVTDNSHRSDRPRVGKEWVSRVSFRGMPDK